MHLKKTVLATLCILMYANAFTQKDLKPYQNLNQSDLLKTTPNAGFGFLFLANEAALKRAFLRVRMSINLKNATIDQVLYELKKKDTSYIFWISRDVHTIKTKASIYVKNATMPDALNVIAEKFPINFNIEKDYIKIYLRRQVPGKDSSTRKYDTAGSFKNAALLDSVKITYTNGYQNVPKEDATDPYLQPDPKEYKTLTTSPNIISRLQMIGWPLLINTGNSLTGSLSYSLRGPNSMFGNQFSTNILDGFRITNTDFYNPFDIDPRRSTHIKTAAAGTLSGTMSANGLNIFETQNGIPSGREVNFFSSFTIAEKADIDYWKTLDAAHTIEAEKLAFQNGSSSNLSPVGHILSQAASRGQSWVDSVLSGWAGNNLRNQIKEEFYQNQVFKQVAFNIRSGSTRFRNYLSFGIDQNEMAEKGNTWGRQTFFGKSSYQDSAFFIQISGTFANIQTRNNFNSSSIRPPYLNLFDAQGNPNSVPHIYSQDIIAYAVQQGFLDIRFSPITESKIADNLEQQQYYSVASKINYTILKGFQAGFSIQFAHTSYDHKINHAVGSFYASNLINQYRTKDAQNNITWNIPVGDIFDRQKINGAILNWRGQLDYNHKWGQVDFSGIAGWEQSRNDMELTTQRIYGKNLSFPQSKIQYDKKFPLALTTGSATIPYYDNQKDSADRFISYYASVYCIYKNKYILSCIARTDLSNRFDSSLNRFGVGLISGGGAWYISKENFFSLPKIKELKIRVSLGVNGNIDYTIRTSRTIQPIDYQGSVYSVVVPNTPKSRWEKTYIGNIGVDFQLGKGVIAGSIDYFKKQGKDLLNIIDWNPISGYNTIKNNSGTVKGKGYDITLDTKDFRITPSVNMAITFLLSHSTNKVTSAVVSTIPAWQLVNPATSSPRKGYPINGIYAFKSAGLDHTNGNPIGYVAKDTSENYDKLVSATDGSSIEYVGSAIPTSLASLVPRIHYKSFTLSAVFTGKFGYYTWIKPLNYAGVFRLQDVATPDYFRRWQKPGDESFTDIPSLQFPLNDNREFFSKFRTTNVIRADHIRLQTIQLSYNFDKSKFPKLPLKKLELFCSVNNLGIIYRANKRGIDPDAPIDLYPAPRSLTFSLLATY